MSVDYSMGDVVFEEEAVMLGVMYFMIENRDYARRMLRRNLSPVHVFEGGTLVYLIDDVVDMFVGVMVKRRVWSGAVPSRRKILRVLDSLWMGDERHSLCMIDRP